MIPAAAETAFRHYLGKGIARAPAAVIIAVLTYESGLRTGSQGRQSTETPGLLNPHGAYGIASWNGFRQARLRQFALANGWNEQGDIPLEIQLDFVLHECEQFYPIVWDAIRYGTNISKFLPLFVRVYEHPARPGRETEGSLPLAHELFNLGD
jgi:Phage tail lysozyme